MDWLGNKILGCLVGAAAGDAMGAATELRTREQIEQRFGGYVKTFLQPPEDTFSRGNRAGQITDDFSFAYVICQRIIECNGLINAETAKEGILRWGENEQYFSRFAGPTTRAAIEEMRGASKASANAFQLAVDIGKATNGAAMKASPIALFSGGDVDKAIQDAITVSLWTHNNNIALSAAAAVAAATAVAMRQDASIYEVIQGGLYGARQGDMIARKVGVTVAGPSVEKRIRAAVTIAETAQDLDCAMRNLSDLIGTGLAAAEAVPTAFGLMAAAKADPETAICAAVNIGNDTDTIATMVGGILGTLKGIECLPDFYLTVIDRENDLDLTATAQSIRSLL